MVQDILACLERLIVIQQSTFSLLAKIEATENETELMDSADMKKLLKISDSSLYRLRQQKLLKCKRIAGKWYYFRPSVL